VKRRLFDPDADGFLRLCAQGCVDEVALEKAQISKTCSQDPLSDGIGKLRP